MKHGLRFGTRVFTAILAITAAGAMLGGYTLMQISKVTHRTEELHRHPLAVSNAGQAIRVEIYTIDSWMKDAVLSPSAEERADFLADIDMAETRVLTNLALIEERFLGDLEQVKAARTAIVAWRSIRSSVMDLEREGKPEAAILMIRGVGAIHVEKMLRLTDTMIAFAQNKANEFLNEARTEEAAAATNTAILISALFIFGLAVALLISRGVTRPLRKLTEASTRFAAGDYSMRTSLARVDELGELSRAFDAMADSVERTVAGLSEQTIILQETAGRLAVRQRSHEAVMAVSNAVGSARKLDELLDGCLTALMSVTHSQVAAIYQRGDGPQLILSMARGVAAGKSLPVTLEMGQGAIGLAAQSGEPVVIDSITDESAFAYQTISGDYLPQCIVHYPLMLGGNVVAVVGLASKRAFDEAFQGILDATSRQIAVALSNMRSLQLTAALALRLTAGNEELSIVNEELQSQAREMRLQAEEMQRQTSELKRQRVQVLAADRLKSEFLSNMSHELRTPMNAVLALTQLLLDRGTGKDPEEERRFLEIINRNGRHLLGLINSILDLSRIEAGTVELEYSTIFPQDVMEQASESIRPLAAEKGLAIVVNAGDCPAMVVDREKLHRVLLNLLSNGVKFTDRGTVTLSADSDEKEIRFAIADTGIGIPGDDQCHIFDEFHQVDGSATPRFGGTGLGLAICRRLLELMDGSIRFESTVGQGSCFTVTLPLTPPSKLVSGATVLLPSSGPKELMPPFARPVEDDAALVASGSRAVLGRTREGPVLVVEDSPDNAEVMESVLADQWELLIAANGEEALELAETHSPALVLMDIQLPGMSGVEAMRGIRKMESLAETPVVAVTARAMLGDRDELMNEGFDDYLPKPFLPADLLALVRKWTGG
jgi:signal transduction histidine kinase/CheY-like chemotaxis protein/HAMP domain-containing protein